MKKFIMFLILVFCLLFNLYGQKRFGLYGNVTNIEYGGGIVLSALVGFGIGNYVTNQDTLAIAFGTMDLIFFTTGGALFISGYLKTFMEGAELTVPKKKLIFYSYITFSLYAVTRLVEFVFVAISPFTNRGRTSKEVNRYNRQTAYINSRMNHVFKYVPNIIKGGIGYSYKF